MQRFGNELSLILTHINPREYNFSSNLADLKMDVKGKVEGGER